MAWTSILGYFGCGVAVVSYNCLYTHSTFYWINICNALLLNLLFSSSYKKFAYLDGFHVLIFSQISYHKSSLSFKYLYIIYLFKERLRLGGLNLTDISISIVGYFGCGVAVVSYNCLYTHTTFYWINICNAWLLNLLFNSSYKKFTYLDGFHILIFIQISYNKSSLYFQISIHYISIYLFSTNYISIIYIYNISIINTIYMSSHKSSMILLF